MFMSLVWTVLSIFIITIRPRTKIRRNRIQRTPLYSPLIPSASYLHTLVGNNEFSLACVNIPIQHATPQAQQIHKNHQRTRIKYALNPRKILYALLLAVLQSNTSHRVYALPDTNHAMINEPSKDIARQRAYVDTIIKNIAQQHHENNAHTIHSTTPDRNTDNTTMQNTPHCFVTDTDSCTYLLDSGANRFIVNDAKMLHHFTITKASVKGISGTSAAIQGIGKLQLSLKSDDNRKTIINVNAVFVPSSPYNIIPPQLLILALKDNEYEVEPAAHDDKQYTFTYAKKNNTTHQLTVKANENDLFMLRTAEGYTRFSNYAQRYGKQWCSFIGNIIPNDSDTEEHRTPTLGQTSAPTPGQTREHVHTIPYENSDFEPLPNRPTNEEFSLTNQLNTKPEDPAVVLTRRKQARLATIHERLGHLSFSRLKLLARSGIIPKELANVDAPVCPGCAYGKAHRKPWRSKGIKNRRHIKVATAPGQVVSVDQLISPTPGFVPTHRGKPTIQRYRGATVFVDHYSDYTYVHLMTEMNAEATVKAKQAFERISATHNVKIRHYHADNGLFDTHAFKLSIQKSGQSLSFCGVNAHHQNGKAENRIKDITTGARTALLHASHRWPKAIHASLWPAALKNYVNLRNALPTEFIPGVREGRGKRKTPDRYEHSPIAKFGDMDKEVDLSQFHPFGSPVYVLENSLQAQKAHNKWTDRSRVGIYLCQSPNHSKEVPLILNTQSGNVSPQFHCIYDDEFNTCRRDAKFTSLWQYKAKLQRPKPGITAEIRRMDEQMEHLPAHMTHDWKQTNDTDPFEQNNNSVIDISSDGDVSENTSQDLPSIEDPDSSQNDNTKYTTRYGRIVQPRKDLDMYQAYTAYINTFSPLPADQTETCLLQPDIMAFAEPHPFAMMLEQVTGFIAKSDPDTMYLEEALRQPDREEFIKAMYKELNDHISRKHWKVVPLKSVPQYKKPIPMVWSMKRKRNPIGEIVKWKARLCAGGHKSIEFLDYWNTYSPVVSWSTVRLIIAIALLNDWHMQSIDFVLAFPQAPVKTDIYMQPPKVPYNFVIPDLPDRRDRHTNVYKLLKNLYGLKDASKTWFDYLRNGLEKRGWVRSEVDECLFTKNGIILVVYVDDAILISPYKSLIQREISSLQNEFDLTDDGVLKDYLGTRFVRQPDGSIHLSQPKMIERVLEIVGFDTETERIKRHDTPASNTKILDKDPDGKPRKQQWNYRSAVGCLSYLQAMIRPDITFAVQQCARFCNEPMQEHEEAVKRICRYLLKTKDKGMVFHPDKSRGLECYVDADFAGSWHNRSSHDPISSHSRTGYVICYGGCPIIWSSKLQPLIALSTTEAEYIALSTALRDVINVQHLMKELQAKGFKLHNATPVIHCKVFEDNKSCIEIATNHKTRPRTKHLSVRLHHFREHVVKKNISIQYINTKQQLGDIFTKGLPRDQHWYLCNRLMGWDATTPTKSEGVREK